MTTPGIALVIAWAACYWRLRADRRPALGGGGWVAGIVIAVSGASSARGGAGPDLADDVGRVVADPVDKRGAARVLVVHPEEVQAGSSGDPAPVPGMAVGAE